MGGGGERVEGREGERAEGEGGWMEGRNDRRKPNTNPETMIKLSDQRQEGLYRHLSYWWPNKMFKICFHANEPY